MLQATGTETLNQKSARLKNALAERKNIRQKSRYAPPSVAKAEAPEEKVAAVEEKKPEEKKKARPRRITGGARKQARARKAKARKGAAPKKRVWKKAEMAPDPVKRNNRNGSTSNLFDIEHQIVQIVSKAKGKPVAIRDIALEIFGKDVANEANVQGAGLQTVRTVRNGVRKPISMGYLKRWTTDNDPEAKPGFVCFVKNPSKAKPQKKAPAKKKEQADKPRAVCQPTVPKRRVLVGSKRRKAKEEKLGKGAAKDARSKAKELVKSETQKASRAARAKASMRKAEQRSK